jgi:hypothetical protein
LWPYLLHWLGIMRKIEETVLMLAWCRRTDAARMTLAVELSAPAVDFHRPRPR